MAEQSDRSADMAVMSHVLSDTLNLSNEQILVRFYFLQ